MFSVGSNWPFDVNILTSFDTWKDRLEMLINPCIAYYQIDVWIRRKIIRVSASV